MKPACAEASAGKPETRNLKPETTYTISNITPGSDHLLVSGVYLVLLNVTRVPPHIALAVQGKLFSLSVKGQTIDGDLRALLKVISQRSTESIFIRLKLPPGFSIGRLSEEIKEKVLAYPRVDVGLATCLAPIKDLCASAYHIEISGVNFIYELLQKLEEIDAIEGCFHLNLDQHLQEGDFFLEKYTMNDIDNEIRRAGMILTL